MARWQAVSFEVPDERADDWIAWSGREALGVTVEPGRDGRSRVTVYFDDPDAARFAVDSLRARGIEAPAARPVADGRWAERYQTSLRPFPVGRRFEIQPAGPCDPAPGREAIVLVPGRAFGTGEHETTRMCVRWLEELVRPGSRWLDVGCGSGILSVVARRCGAARVLAIDVDPEAVEVARETLDANRIDGVEVAEGSLPLAARERFDGVVCNIALGFFAAGAGLLADTLVPGGSLIATGFLVADRNEATALLREAGWIVAGEGEGGEWLSLAARTPR